MAPRLVKEGKIQILGQTANSVVYAVANDSKTGWAKDSLSVLKGGTVWYEGREALGPGKDAQESDERARKEAGIYEALGQHDCILGYFGLEATILGGSGSVPKAWAVRLERAPYGSLRDYIINNSANPPDERTRLKLATQFTEGVAHMHLRGVVWGDLSTRNVFLFDQWRIKLGDFADSDQMDDYPHDWYGCEIRYCPPGSDRPQCHNIGTMNREMFALGSAIYEISEWKVPYGSETEVSEDEVKEALLAGEWPQLSNDNPTGPIISRLWGYMYESSEQVVNDLRGLF
ncbi:kinase-like domain-containing protein [Thelonectria olida]|uniref:Kinase-like domain-containing protein n=1 Tax=Thelonectria olida TaxID=1576542 RepID=A0A9P9AQ77_9HYPO|nr:kinase-like domain-containing protein [Thelonectria olida]